MSRINRALDAYLRLMDRIGVLRVWTTLVSAVTGVVSRTPHRCAVPADFLTRKPGSEWVCPQCGVKMRVDRPAGQAL